MAKRNKKADARGRKSAPTPAPVAPAVVDAAPAPPVAALPVAGLPVAALPVAGLRHLATVAAVVVALSLATYASRELLRFRPWEPGEGVPVVRLFQRGAEGQVASAAEPAGPVDPEGADVAAPEGRLDPILLAAAEEEGEGEGEVESEGEGEGESEGEGEGESEGAGEGEGERAPIVAASEVAGLPLEIEDRENAMDAFYRSLERTARGEPVITRIAHFGDSTIAFDGITQTVRERMQRRFGDAGSGFVLATRGTLPYGHHHVRTESEGDWRLLDITHSSLSDGRYGLGGAQARADAGASAWFETANERSLVGRVATRFQVLYQRFERGGRFDYRVDGGAWTSVDTRLEGASEGEGEGASEVEGEGEAEGEGEGEGEGAGEDAGVRNAPQVVDAVLDVDVEAGAHRLSIRTMGHGESRIYGVVVENGERGVVYDSLGMVGARAQRMLNFDPEHLAGQLAARESALVVVAFGGNDADDERTEAEFEYTFRRVARLVRQARPEASCLLMAPLDQAQRDERGAITTLATIPAIVEAMRSAARHEGCAFFDTWTAMGGEGAMGRWFREEPRLSGSDFRHATPAGYRVIGEMFYRALLMGFRRYERR